ncbi:hypothetical protein SteCoe_13834 [Stentor coeruleus]|uniref:Uncharacterized protein n=1 Tax=Stentor coeruleus TaxID=5963 RepID=A0A1R2C7I9_9CILI|nr:hypothetical protein SteCoe_13834 [Stentor coeruleus]
MSETMQSEAETYALEEIRKLRVLYQSALSFRLETKKKMRDIVLHWMNVKISQFFMKWKQLRVKYTYYQKVKMKWISHLQKRRFSQKEAVKTNREKFDRKKYMVANMVRNEAHINAIERKTKTEIERRAMTAQVNAIRNLLKSRVESRRKCEAPRNFKSASGHCRAFSFC